MRRSLVIDFDGTACLHDVSEDLLDRFGDPSWSDLNHAVARREVGLREALDRQAAMLRGDEEEFLTYAAWHCPMDPTFAPFVKWAEGEGYEVSVASDGFGFYIPPMLAAAGLDHVGVFTNRFEIAGGVPRLTHPDGNPSCHGCGTCKMLAVERAREGGLTVFVGEGLSDRYGAMHADVAFAKDVLVTICERDGTPFREWNDFDDVRRSLEEAPPERLNRAPGPPVCVGWMPVGAAAPWRLRGADRPGDDERVLAVHVEAEQHDLGQVHTQIEDIRADWSRPSIDPASDTLLVEDPTSGEVVAAVSLERHGRFDAAVRPGFRGRGVGTTILRWAERESLARATDGTEVAVGQTIGDEARDAAELLGVNGYTPFYTAWILQLPADAPTPDHAPPDGVEFRSPRWPEEAEGCFRIIEDAFAHWPGRAPNTFENWFTWFSRDDFDPSAAVVAEDETGLVGVVAPILPGEFWIQQVAVRVDRQSRGIGSAMLAHTFRLARERGYATVGLSTDSRTGALGVYERVGMQVTDSFTHHRKVLRAAR